MYGSPYFPDGLSSNMLQTLHVQILPKKKKKDSGFVYVTVWKLTIIFDSRRPDVNPRSHLVTIFNDVVQPAIRYHYQRNPFVFFFFFITTTYP